MINFKTITTETPKNSEELLSLLTWQIHPAKNILFPNTNALTANTTRRLIGKMSIDDKKFTITRLRPFLNSFLPQVFVKGQLKENGRTTVLTIKYSVGIFTFVMLLFLFYFTGLFVWELLTKPTSGEIIIDTVIWIILFPVTGILLTFWEITKTTDMLYDILGLDTE